MSPTCSQFFFAAKDTTIDFSLKYSIMSFFNNIAIHIVLFERVMNLKMQHFHDKDKNFTAPVQLLMSISELVFDTIDDTLLSCS